MILNMTGSGGSRLRAKAYAAFEDLPLEARDGSIAVISDVPVKNTVVQNTEPAEPAAGDVWINTGVISANAILLGNVTIYPVSVKQYNGSEWKALAAYVYSAGAWQTLDTYLFQSGDPKEPMTGGWLATTQMNGVAEFAASALEAAAGTANASYNRVAFRTKNTIDLSAYKTLKATFSPLERNHSSSGVGVGVSSTAFAEGKLSGDTATVINTPAGCMSGYTFLTGKHAEIFTLEYDISALTESLYVVVYFGSVECSCTSVQLIP